MSLSPQSIPIEMQCSLCLDPISETIMNSDSKKREIYVDLIVQKLFGLCLDISQITQMCTDCDRVIIECFMFYEKVSKAQPNLFKTKNAIFVSGDNIKAETAEKAADLNDDSNYDVKVEAEDGSFSHEDDIVLHQYVAKLQASETSSIKNEKKSKKKKKMKKSEIKKKKPIKEKDLEVSDPNNLIDSNGMFIVQGSKLEALLSKFFILTCDVCEMKHSSIKDLFGHYEKQHNTKGYVTCCGKKLVVYKKLKFHMAKHVQPSAFNCTDCNKSLASPAALKYHMLSHLPMEEKPLQCDECGKRFVHQPRLNKHKLLHLPMDQRPFFQCKFCDKTFTVKTTYSAHLSVMHTYPKFLCTQCGKNFRDKTQFTNHMKRHEPDSVRSSERVKCDICGVVLAHKLGLQTHMRRHESKFPCPHCNYVARRKIDVKKHIQVRHTEVKPYVCVVCNKEFKWKHSMKVHMAQHTGERKYSCPFCPRTFVDPGNCYSHKKKMHPIEYQNESEMRKLRRRSISSQNLKKSDDCSSNVENDSTDNKITSQL